MKRMFLCFKKDSISYLEIYKIFKDLIDSYFRITSTITMGVNKAVWGILKYEKVLGNAINNTLCKIGIQHLCIKFIYAQFYLSRSILPHNFRIIQS